MWTEAPLKTRLLHIDAGRSPDLPDVPASPGEWGVLKVSAVHSGGFRPKENKSVNSAALADERFEVHPGDLLFSRANTPELVGSACIAVPTVERLLLSDKTLRLVVNPALADTRFVNICLAGRDVRRQIEVAASGSSRSMQNISQRSVEGLRFWWPSVEEQRRIVEVLDAVTEAERGVEASIAKLRTVRHSVVSAEIPTRVDDSLAWSARVPVRWVPVKDAGSVRMGKQLSPDSRAAGKQFPYLRVANVLDGRIDYADVKTMGFTESERDVYSLRPGDILLNEGQSLELVGRSAIYEHAAGEFCFQNTLVRFRSGDGLLPRYAQAVFKLWLTSGVFAQIAKKTTSIAHLGGERFGALRFPLVPLAEQQRIIDLIDTWDKRIESDVKSLAKLRVLKQGLADDLLSARCG
ncbi:restriction endonuclease subunit S [Streptomyces kronopolitis]